VRSTEVRIRRWSAPRSPPEAATSARTTASCSAGAATTPRWSAT
jgi:hypothetical protein